MTIIDVSKLREHISLKYGTAAFNGFDLAIADLTEILNLDDFELCKFAEEHGVDLTRFEID